LGELTNVIILLLKLGLVSDQLAEPGTRMNAA